MKYVYSFKEFEAIASTVLAVAGECELTKDKVKDWSVDQYIADMEKKGAKISSSIIKQEITIEFDLDGVLPWLEAVRKHAVLVSSFIDAFVSVANAFKVMFKTIEKEVKTSK